MSSGCQTKTVPERVLRAFCVAALKSRGVRTDVLEHVTSSLLQTSLRAVDSHGLELLPHYIDALDSGRINPDPRYRFEQTAPSTGKLDADHTFGHAAGGEAVGHAVELARQSGMGAVAVFDSSHNGAQAYFSLLAAEQGMLGFSFTHADSLLLSHDGTRPFFGTNPLSCAAPCREEPFSLDMAPTHVTWNKVRLHRAAGESMPAHWACDDRGNPTTDPLEAAGLLPIGTYKGYGLSMMVEILCSLLTGMPFGRDISKMYVDTEKKRYLGQFYMALDISCFEDPQRFRNRLQAMMEQVRSEPGKDPQTPPQVPGDPEKKAAAERHKEGIPISEPTYERYLELAQEIGFDGFEE